MVTTGQAETEGVGKKKGRDTPAYISYTTFTTFLDWIKDMPVTPRQLDRTLWGPKFAGSTGIQLLSGLRFLGLLDDIIPTPALDQLARADKQGRDGQMREILRAAYGANLVDELPSATPKIVEDALAALGTTPSTHHKAVSFFINAAKLCGIHVPTAISKKARIKAPRLAKAPKPLEPSKNGSKADVKVPVDKLDPNAGHDYEQHQAVNVAKVTLPWAEVILTVNKQNLIELAKYPEDMKWFQELMYKFTEKINEKK